MFKLKSASMYAVFLFLFDVGKGVEMGELIMELHLTSLIEFHMLPH